MKSVTTKTTVKQPTIEDFRDAVLKITGDHGVRNVRIFGSFARNEQRKTSDVDLLVKLPDRFSLLDLSGLKIDLEEAIGRKVDVIPDDSIKPALRERILSEARSL